MGIRIGKERGLREKCVVDKKALNRKCNRHSVVQAGNKVRVARANYYAFKLASELLIIIAEG